MCLLRIRILTARLAGLDDDELDRFTDKTLGCGPREYCGLSMAGKEWPRIFADGTRTASNNLSMPLILSRNAWAGAQKHGVALWSSDIVCTWQELRAQVPTGLSSGLSGIPYWSSDVAGFAGQPTPELAMRYVHTDLCCSLLSYSLLLI